MTRFGNLSQEQAIDKAWDLVDSIGVCMFVTWDGERQRGRPVSARPNRQRHAIYILTDETSAKGRQIQQFPTISLAFADHASNHYLAITGYAGLSNDREIIRDIFSIPDKAWWSSADDPGIRLITVTPEDAEIWGGVGYLRAAVGLVRAAITGATPDLGDNRKIDHI